MKRYRIGFKWDSGEEYYFVLKSTASSTELAEHLKKTDKTGKLSRVYIKTLNE